MLKVKFLAPTLTRKGRFNKGDVADFPENEVKDLQKLSSVESPAPTESSAPPVKTVKKKKKVVRDESKG